MIYSACDGKMADMKALEDSSYIDFCVFINNYMERKEREKEEYDKLSKQLKKKS